MSRYIAWGIATLKSSGLGCGDTGGLRPSIARRTTASRAEPWMQLRFWWAIGASCFALHSVCSCTARAIFGATCGAWRVVLRDAAVGYTLL